MPRRSAGFTLIELIIVIVIVGILSVVVAPLMGRGYSGIAQSNQRAFWVQQAEYAVFHLRQDLQRSVPNSVRTPINSTDVQAVEFLGFSQHSAAPMVRYRHQPASGFDALQISGDSSFDVFGALALSQPTSISIGGNSSAELLNDWQSSSQTSSLAPIDAVTTRSSCDCGDCALCPVSQLTLANAPRVFRSPSPFYRAYLTDGPVAYQCRDGHLLRHSGYSQTSNTDLSARLALAPNPVSARVIDSVLSCRFDWHPGTTGQPPSLTVQLSVGSGSEQIRLVDTIVLSAAP